MNIADISKTGAGRIVQVNPAQLECYIDNLTRENMRRGDRARAEIASPEALAAHREKVRASFLRSLGAMPSGYFAGARVTGRFETGGLVCENLLLETLPGFFATANVYKPAGRGGRLPAVLMVCGHSPEGRMNPVYQRVQRIIASAGFVVMGLDPIGQGERISYYEEGSEEPLIEPCTREHDYAGLQCLLTGMTVTGFFVHDGICALDYLASRGDVDAARIGVTGSSGGGTQTSMLMMAAPEKIAAAAPATFLSDREAILDTRQAQDLEQIWPGMAADGFDHADVLACMAPKPVLLLCVDSDFFPLEGAHRTYTKAEPLWKMFGKENALEIFTDTSKHAYTRALAEAAARFFVKHLGAQGGFEPQEPFWIESEKLFAAGGSVVKTLGSKLVHDFAAERLERLENEKRRFSLDSRREEAADFIRAMVDACRPYPLYLKRNYNQSEGFRGFYNLAAEYYTWRQQEGIVGYGMYLTRLGVTPKKAVIALWDGGTSVLHRRLDDVMDLCDKGYSVFVVDLPGTGSLGENLYSESRPDYYYTRMTAFCCDLLVNGDSLPAMRVRAVLRAYEALRAFAGESIETGLLSAGRFNLYALAAKLIEPSFAFVDEREPFEGFSRLVERKYYNHNNLMAYIMPGMLEKFDIPDLREFTR